MSWKCAGELRIVDAETLQQKWERVATYPVETEWRDVPRVPVSTEKTGATELLKLLELQHRYQVLVGLAEQLYQVAAEPGTYSSRALHELRLHLNDLKKGLNL